MNFTIKSPKQFPEEDRPYVEEMGQAQVYFTKAVYVVFHSKEKLDAAMNEVEESGCKPSDVQIEVCHNGNILDMDLQQASMAMEGAIWGGLAGIILSVLLVFVGGVEFAEPVKIGRLASFLATMGVCWLVGTVSGGLIGMAVPKYRKSQFNTDLAEGSILVRVRTNDASRTKKAEEILVRHGGVHVLPGRQKKYARKA